MYSGTVVLVLRIKAKVDHVEADDYKHAHSQIVAWAEEDIKDMLFSPEHYYEDTLVEDVSVFDSSVLHLEQDINEDDPRDIR